MFPSVVTQCPQLLYQRFSAGLWSNLLPGCNVVVVDDLQNFRSYESTITIINSIASSLFSPWSRFLMRFSWKELLVEESNTNLKRDHHHFFDRKLIKYAAGFLSICPCGQLPSLICCIYLSFSDVQYQLVCPVS